MNIDDILISNEKGALLIAVSETVVRHAITTDKIIKCIERMGHLTDIGVDPYKLLDDETRKYYK